MDQTKYIEQLQSVIRHLHRCEATHLNTEFVREVINGKTLWHQTVERFTVTGHPRATRCYAWGDRSGGDCHKYIAILEIPPIRSASDAVKYSMVANEGQPINRRSDSSSLQ